MHFLYSSDPFGCVDQDFEKFSNKVEDHLTVPQLYYKVYNLGLFIYFFAPRNNLDIIKVTSFSRRSNAFILTIENLKCNEFTKMTTPKLKWKMNKCVKYI